MSIEVPLTELPEYVTRRAFAYLVTVDEDARPRLLAVDVVARDGSLTMDVGRTAMRNLAVHPSVSLAFPPIDRHDNDRHDAYTLLVDGTAAATGDGRISMEPTWAVLHRPAPPFSG